jgi:hypothetical protein
MNVKHCMEFSPCQQRHYRISATCSRLQPPHSEHAWCLPHTKWTDSAQNQPGVLYGQWMKQSTWHNTDPKPVEEKAYQIQTQTEPSFNVMSNKARTEDRQRHKNSRANHCYPQSVLRDPFTPASLLPSQDESIGDMACEWCTN